MKFACQFLEIEGNISIMCLLNYFNPIWVMEDRVSPVKMIVARADGSSP